MRVRSLKPALVVSGVLGTLMALLALAGPDAAADTRDAGGPADAGASRDAGGFMVSKSPPDPSAMSERQQWVFDLRWDRGEVYLLEVHKIDMGEPHVTPRVMGRFALELFEGPTVIERVRFDFPMLGVEAPDAGMKTAPRFEPKLKTRIGVLFPATKRGTKLELWDRARDVRMNLPWPPREGPTVDGGFP